MIRKKPHITNATIEEWIEGGCPYYEVAEIPHDEAIGYTDDPAHWDTALAARVTQLERDVINLRAALARLGSKKKKLR